MNSITLLYASPSQSTDDLFRFLDLQHGFDVHAVQTGIAALERLDRGGVDVLLFGRTLPDLSAAELLQQARCRDPLLPTVALIDGEGGVGADCLEQPTTVVQMQQSDPSVRVSEAIWGIIRILRGENTVSTGHNQAVLDRVSDGFYALDDDWRFSSLNEHAQDLLQQSAEDLIGRNIWEVFPDAAETILFDEFMRVAETGETAEFDIYYEPLETWFWVTVYPVQSGVSVYLRDITDRMLQSWAMDSAEMGIVITDPHKPDNPIIYANSGFEELTGYSEFEARGRNCRFLQGPRTDSESVARIRSAIDSREPITVEIINYRKNGTPFWNQLQITPVFDPNETLTHFIGFQQDVTARVEEERRAELLNRVLRHNLRNSLNVILGQVSNLEELSTLEHSELEPIIEHGEDLLRIAEQARDIDAVLETEQFEPKPIRLEEPLSAAINTAHRIDSTAEITTNVPSDLRVIASGSLVVAFEELLANSIKHAKRSPPTVTVTARLGTQCVPPDGAERPVVEVTIVDSGPPLSDQERIALTGDQETPLRHGSGLGLWLVQWIVTLSGGSITVTDDADGNTITVTLLAD